MQGHDLEKKFSVSHFGMYDDGDNDTGVHFAQQRRMLPSQNRYLAVISNKYHLDY